MAVLELALTVGSSTGCLIALFLKLHIAKDKAVCRCMVASSECNGEVVPCSHSLVAVAVVDDTINLASSKQPHSSPVSRSTPQSS